MNQTEALAKLAFTAYSEETNTPRRWDGLHANEREGWRAVIEHVLAAVNKEPEEDPI